MTGPSGSVTASVRVDSRGPGHTRVSVFVGRNPGARGHAGSLTLRTDEWDEIASCLLGIDPEDGQHVEAIELPLVPTRWVVEAVLALEAAAVIGARSPRWPGGGLNLANHDRLVAEGRRLTERVYR